MITLEALREMYARIAGVKTEEVDAFRHVDSKNGEITPTVTVQLNSRRANLFGSLTVTPVAKDEHKKD